MAAHQSELVNQKAAGKDHKNPKFAEAWSKLQN